MSMQLPPLQAEVAWGTLQVRLHPPQLERSELVSMHAPWQHEAPCMQAVPHEPQFFTDESESSQAWPQHFEPGVPSAALMHSSSVLHPGTQAGAPFAMPQ